MPAQRQRRLPLSCENCRRRKIRCFGEGTPCQPCVRRNVSSTCHFLRSQTNGEPRKAAIATEPCIVERLEALEGLVRENICLTKSLDLNNVPEEIAGPTQNTLNSGGQLIHSPTGHVRYACTQNMAAEFSQDVNPMDLPFSDIGVTTRQDLLDLLPPLSHCDELKAVFMEVFSPLFHILHDPTFEREYAVFRKNPQEVRLSFLALVFVVLSIGVTALDEGHPLLADLGRQAVAGANVRDLSIRYRNAAMRTLTVDHFLWRHNLQTLQTLVLLIYALSHTHGPAWSLLGTTLNSAVAIGCHVDPSRLRVGAIEAEERRRCWSALLMLYNIQATIMGLQAPILIQSDTKPPIDIEDEDLSDSANVIDLITRNSKPVSKMTYILQKFNLYRLASDICSLNMSGSRGDAKVGRLDDMIKREQDKHQALFNPSGSLPLYHQAHYHILNIYTSQLCLVLHSPILIQSDMPQTNSTMRNMARLSEASFVILANYDILRKKPKFQKYRWYADGLGSFYAFLAASTLLMLHGKAYSDEQRDEKTQIELCRCLAYFRAAQSRSDTCARAEAFLSRMLIASRSGIAQPSDSAVALNLHDSGSDGMQYRRADDSRYMDASNISHTIPRIIPDRINPIRDTHNIDIDLNGWTASAEFQEFFHNISSHQWLSPSLFPWSDWDDNSYGIENS